MWNSALHGKIDFQQANLRGILGISRGRYMVDRSTDRAVEDTRRYAVLEFKGVLPRE
jgi:hypothetical protein